MQPASSSAEDDDEDDSVRVSVEDGSSDGESELSAFGEVEFTEGSESSDEEEGFVVVYDEL